MAGIPEPCSHMWKLPQSQAPAGSRQPSPLCSAARAPADPLPTSSPRPSLMRCSLLLCSYPFAVLGQTMEVYSLAPGVTSCIQPLCMSQLSVQICPDPQL